MKAWSPTHYLRFRNQRTQPAIDLVNRLEIESPQRVVDLGCGPGNSTEVMARRWPEAEIIGLDSSAEMLATAKESHPEWTWQQVDASQWEAPSDARPDVLFSNACLQWLPNHEMLFPRLLRQVAAGGALAVQLPYHIESPLHQSVKRTATDSRWADRMTKALNALTVEPVGFYYDHLSAEAARLELWETHYFHVMDGPEDILNWIRATGLRPFHAALASEKERAAFDEQVLAGYTEAYPPQCDGKVLFRFPRLFIVAYRD